MPSVKMFIIKLRKWGLIRGNWIIGSIVLGRVNVVLGEFESLRLLGSKTVSLIIILFL